MVYDLIIIGAGPAGITASVYAARKRMNFLVISKDIGGQTAWSADIENYTGYQFITGQDLTEKFKEHIERYKVEVKEGEEVVNLTRGDGLIKIRTKKGDYQAKTAIVASGKVSKELDVPGEEEFKNKGLSYCATCDGPIFTGKDVAIIGGGNSALDAAIQLDKIASKIYIINIAKEITGDPVMQERLKDSSKVSIMNSTKVKAVLGNKFVNSLKIERDGAEETLSVQGVFVEIGLVPNSLFAEELKMNENKEIVVNCDSETNMPGVFAAGDVTSVPEKQIIIAAGEGAKAALAAFRYLTRNKAYRETY